MTVSFLLYKLTLGPINSRALKKLAGASICEELGVTEKGLVEVQIVDQGPSVRVSLSPVKAAICGFSNSYITFLKVTQPPKFIKPTIEHHAYS